MPAPWQVYTCLENHDLELDQDGEGHRMPRIARLAGGDAARSWYARSRARAATGLLLTAPGIPALFMGQEFLEDKLWIDDVGRTDRFIWSRAAIVSSSVGAANCMRNSLSRRFGEAARPWRAKES